MVLLPPTVSGMIPEPQNARISSVNLHSTLQWDAPRFPRGNLTYTVQSKRWGWAGLAFLHIPSSVCLGFVSFAEHGLSPYFRDFSVPGAVPLFQPVRGFSAELKDRAEAFPGHSHIHTQGSFILFVLEPQTHSDIGCYWLCVWFLSSVIEETWLC